MGRPYDEAVDRLIANGYSPLALSGKHPIEVEWPRSWNAPPPLDQVEERSGHGHNVGVALGYNQTIAIDIDTDYAEIDAAVRLAVAESNVVKRGRVGSTGFYRIKGPAPPSRTFLGRNGEPIVELLSVGRQTVVPPSIHPETGKPYQWLTRATLLDTHADQLAAAPDDIAERLERVLHPWLGERDLYPGLSWASPPDMTGSEAPEVLQRIWIAAATATREIHGALRLGRCGLLNLAALPLVERALGESVVPCAGYAMFVVPGHGRLELGSRWMPEKWRRHLDCQPSDDPLDVHAWLETSTHVIDLATYQIAARPGLRGTWPPLICWPKATLAKHPREAQGRRTALLWRNARALESVSALMAFMVPPITARAMQILDRMPAAVSTGREMERA